MKRAHSNPDITNQGVVDNSVAAASQAKAKGKQPKKRKLTAAQLKAVDNTFDSVLSQSSTQSQTDAADIAAKVNIDMSELKTTVQSLSDEITSLKNAINNLVLHIGKQGETIDQLLTQFDPVLHNGSNNQELIDIANQQKDYVDRPTVTDAMEQAVAPGRAANYAAVAAIRTDQSVSSRVNPASTPTAPRLAAPRLHDTVAAMYVDQHEHSRRANNVVVSGLQPIPGVSDRESVSALIEMEFNFVPHIAYIRRLGQSQPNRIRPLLITLKHDEASWLVEHAKDLRYSDDPCVRKSIFINADLTRAEALAAYEIRCRRRRTRPARSEAIAGSQSGRTFINKSLRGSAAVDDQQSHGGQAMAVDSVSAAAGSSSTTDSLTADISSSQSLFDVWAMQSAQIATRPCPCPPMGSPSSNPVHGTAAEMSSSSSAIADASTAGLAMMATGSVSARNAGADITASSVAVPASVSNLAAGQSTTSPSVSATTGGNSQPTLQ